MCNQYEADEVYFYYSCVKHPAVMNETDFSYYKIHWRKGILGLKYQFIFMFIFNTFRFNLYLLRKSYSLFQNV